MRAGWMSARGRADHPRDGLGEIAESVAVGGDAAIVAGSPRCTFRATTVSVRR